MADRRKEIEQAATEHVNKGGGPSDTCPNCQTFNWAGFVTGAEWADAHPVVTDIYRSLDRAHQAEETKDYLIHILKKIDLILRIPAAEYVPSISDVFTLIDETLTNLKVKND